MITVPITIQMAKDYKAGKIVPLYSGEKVALSICSDSSKLSMTKDAQGKKIYVVSLAPLWKAVINAREPYLLYDGPVKIYVHKDNAEEI